MPVRQGHAWAALRSRAAFTIIEMLVVVGIILLISALSLPLFVNMTKAGKLRQARETVKMACVFARSQAIRGRRMVGVTLLGAERQVIVNDYETLRHVLPLREYDVAAASAANTLVRETSTAGHSGYYVTLLTGFGTGQTRRIKSCSGKTLTLDTSWTPQNDGGWTAPGAGDEYAVGGRDYKAVNPHFVGNYADADQRHAILRRLTVESIRNLPDGCRFDLRNETSNTRPAWTYVFLPAGGVWTITSKAENSRDDDNWKETTYVVEQDGKDLPGGPLIYGPKDEQSAQVIVYAMSGQAVTQ